MSIAPSKRLVLIAIAMAFILVGMVSAAIFWPVDLGAGACAGRTPSAEERRACEKPVLQPVRDIVLPRSGER